MEASIGHPQLVGGLERPLGSWPPDLLGSYVITTSQKITTDLLIINSVLLPDDISSESDSNSEFGSSDSESSGESDSSGKLFCVMPWNSSLTAKGLILYELLKNHAINFYFQFYRGIYLIRHDCSSNTMDILLYFKNRMFCIEATQKYRIANTHILNLGRAMFNSFQSG